MRLLVSTAVLLAGMSLAPAQTMPGGQSGGGAAQERQQPQGRGGQAQQGSQEQGKQVERADRQSDRDGPRHLDPAAGWSTAVHQRPG
jgi:hypothetical protein